MLYAIGEIYPLSWAHQLETSTKVAVSWKKGLYGEQVDEKLTI